MKTKLKTFIERAIPPGANVSAIPKFLIFGYIFSEIYSLTFWHKYFDKYFELFTTVGNVTVLSGEMMTSFGRLHDGCTLGFRVFAVLCVMFVIYYCIYYRQGSKSIYLMRRLPKRFELLKSIVALPLLMSLTFALTSVLTSAIYFALYVLITPNECLLPLQWQNLWRFLL